MAGKMRVMFIFEMLGRPAEHLKKTLEEFVERIGKENGIEIRNKVINEPKKIETSGQELYTSFAEIEAEVKDILSLIRLVFTHLPSHIEIIEPEEIKSRNSELNNLMNELTIRLHRYDEIAKSLAIERKILIEQLQGLGVQPKTLQMIEQQRIQQMKPQGQQAKKENPKQKETKEKTGKKTAKKKAKKR